MIYAYMWQFVKFCRRYMMISSLTTLRHTNAPTVQWQRLVPAAAMSGSARVTQPGTLLGGQ